MLLLKWMLPRLFLTAPSTYSILASWSLVSSSCMILAEGVAPGHLENCHLSLVLISTCMVLFGIHCFTAAAAASAADAVAGLYCTDDGADAPLLLCFIVAQSSKGWQESLFYFVKMSWILQNLDLSNFGITPKIPEFLHFVESANKQYGICEKITWAVRGSARSDSGRRKFVSWGHSIRLEFSVVILC